MSASECIGIHTAGLESAIDHLSALFLSEISMFDRGREDGRCAMLIGDNISVQAEL